MELTQEQIVRIQRDFKVPVNSDFPGNGWVSSLSKESEMPTDEELKQLRGYIEFVLIGDGSIYGAYYGSKIVGQALPLLPGHNSLVFRKATGENSGWCYRRQSWSVGPIFVPSITEKNFRPHTLVEVMDRIEKDCRSRQWNNWKVAHSDVFPIT